MNRTLASGALSAGHGRTVTRSAAFVLALALLASAILHASPAQAAVSSVTISGGVTHNGTVYAKQGDVLTVTVVTSPASCKVELTGAHAANQTTSPAANDKTTWTFNVTVGAGTASRSVTAAATSRTSNNKCEINNSTGSASYFADNTNPTITPTITPTPNGAGWNNADATVTWAGSDDHSGFAAATGASPNPSPTSVTQTGETSGTTLSSTGKDRVGNSGTGSVVVKLDKTKPHVTVPANITAEATSGSGAVVTFSTSAGDVLSGPSVITPSCSSASGATFGLGTTTVNCSATDVAGNTETKSFTITVSDTVGPVFSNVPNIASAEGDTLGGRVVTWTDPTADDAVSGNRSVACLPASGHTFEVGTTTVTCSATDAANNSNTASFNVIVTDTTKPVLTIPGDFFVEATSSNGAEVTYNASAHDTVDGARTPTCAPPSESLFPLGPNTVNCSATDLSNNTATGSFVATVRDTTAPVFGAAPTVTPFEATGSNGAVVTYATPVAADAVSGNITGICLPASDDLVAIGTHTVTCNATDDAGNPATPLEFSVTVQDTTPPEMSPAPADQTLEATSAAGAVATFDAPTAVDVVDGSRVVTCNPLAGSTFNIGETTVTCSASDTRGNQASRTFTITVEDTTGPTITVPGDITVAAATADGTEVTFLVTAIDAVDPVVNPTCTPASGALFAVGTTTVTCNAKDTRDNPADPATFTVTVDPFVPAGPTMSFGGFLRPVDARPTVNRAKAGSAIPVKFSLGGDFGRDIWGTNPNGTTGPQVISIACNATAPVDTIDETVTAGGSSLNFDAASSTYNYVWKTNSAWAGTCRQLVLRLANGDVQRADFNFTK